MEISALAKRTNNDPNNQRSAATPSTPVDFDPDVPSREAMLDALRTETATLSPDELAERMGVTREATRVGFDRRLAAMERDGQLMPNRKGVLLLANKLDFIAGRVQGH